MVLDTDHVTALGSGSAAGLQLLERIGSSGEKAVTTVITVEEQLRGWLAEIHRVSDPRRQIIPYERLRQRIEFFTAWTVLPWDTAAADQFIRFRRAGLRIARWIDRSRRSADHAASG